MHERFKKIIALTLSVIMLFSVYAIAAPVGAAAADDAAPGESTDGAGYAQKSTEKLSVIQNRSGDDIPLDAVYNVRDTADSGDQSDKLKKMDLAPVGAEEEQAPVPAYFEGDAFVNFKGAFIFDGFDERIEILETKTFAKGTSMEKNYAVVHSDSMTTQEIIDSFSDNEYVDYVTPNSITKPTAITNDTYSAYQWALENTGQNNGTKGIDTNPETLWNKISSSSKECVVAVIDTGVDLNHEDLQSVLWKNTYRQLEGYGSCGYDFTGTVSSGEPRDDDGHGTHIAGIIAAQANNNLGISGINKANVKIMALRVQKIEYYKGELVDYYDSDAIRDAFDYIIRAKELGVNIVAVNCSYGGPYLRSQIEEYNTLCDNLGKMGIVTCIAAGNEDVNIDLNYYWDNENSKYVYYDGGGMYYVGPAACESKYAVTVSASAEDGYLAGFSNYGMNVDISAPGTSILSTVCTNTFQPSIYSSSLRSSTCKYYQGFDGSVSDSDLFGTLDVYNSYAYPNIEITDDLFFGTGGSSLHIHTDSGLKDRGVLFSTPFNLSSTTAAYDITFSIRGTKPDSSPDCIFYLVDKPYVNGALDGAFICGVAPTYDWHTIHLHVDPTSTEDYERTTNRDLVLVVQPLTNDSCDLFIDGIGISKQNINTSLYGKYDFYPGTSMATPYVAGAVALISGAYPTAGAMDKINAIYKSAASLSQIKDAISGGKFLDLKNIPTNMPTTVLPTGISVSPSTASIEVGQTTTLTATVSPSNATDKTVTWSSSNSSVAAVSNSGVVTGKGVGTADITAKTSNGKTAKCTVTVKANSVPPTGISVSPTSATITIGQTKTLTATVTPSNASNKSVTWISSDSKIAEVSSTGVVTGKGIGVATITAKTTNNLTATAKITVESGEVAPTGIKIAPTSATVEVGSTVTLTATVSPSNATDKSVRWSSADAGIAKVSSSGVVTGVSAGTVAITAKTSNGKSASATVTVMKTSIEPTAIKIEPETAMIGVSEKLSLSVTFTPSNATNKTLTWSSSDSKVAAVSSEGVVTGKGVGTATITARTSKGKTATCKVTVKDDPVRIYMDNIRQIKGYLNTHYAFYDQDGKNIKINYRYKDGRYGSVYYILADDDSLMFYLIAHVNDSLTLHTFFSFDFAYSFDIAPTILLYQDNDLIFEVLAALNARTYDPEVGTTAIYDRQTVKKITDEDDIELANSALDLAFYEIGDCLGYLMGFELGDIGFDNLSKLGEYNPDLYARGDYDKDGDITILDATRTQYMLSDLVYVPEEDFLAGIDADGDGGLTILDATRIQRYLADICDMNGRPLSSGRSVSSSSADNGKPAADSTPATDVRRYASGKRSVTDPYQSKSVTVKELSSVTATKSASFSPAAAAEEIRNFFK